MIQTTSLLLISIIAVSFLLQVEGNPFLISDDRVRKLDIAPVLGRGYSIMTDTYMSTCLIVDDTTVPSFNYDCKCRSSISPCCLFYLSDTFLIFIL